MCRKHTSARKLQDWRRKKKGEVDDEARSSGGVPQFHGLREGEVGGGQEDEESNK